MRKKVLLVSAKYYPNIASNLKTDAEICLDESRGSNKIFINSRYIEVPGVFEIPVTISKKIKNYHAIIALGCVIKGQTPHFDFISNAATQAIMELSVVNRKPIGNGIITCLNMTQARARRKKGAEAAEAVISVLSQK